ncbi:MAG TPA: hypoxanthine phosphoribosyltransferase [Lachnospiraceae bacterium]|nr:hypoxanthine phosphoribosyltransferase [Lachnospiraceae bacterium]
MKENITELISEEKIENRIREMAAQIEKDYAGEEVLFICTLRGAAFFACELAKRTKLPINIDFIAVKSYGMSSESSGNIKLLKDLDEDIADRHVLVIEDIVDTGRTLSYLMENLKKRNPRSLKLCALLDKPARRVKPIEADYVGFTIEDLFVVGYGLDYAQKYRNLPFVGVVEI